MITKVRSTEDQKQFPDPLNIGFVVCQVATCGHTGSHDENELNNAEVNTGKKKDTLKRKAHIVDFDKWVDSTGFATRVFPFIDLVDNILQQSGED